MSSSTEISRLYTQTFNPETVPFRGFVTTGEEKEGMVAVEITAEEALLPWHLWAIYTAFQGIAWLWGVKNELPTQVSAQWVQDKRVNDPFGFRWKNRDFELRRVEKDTPKIIPERGTLYLENGECGWIGTDKTYHLKRDLRLSDGSPYPGEEEDRLCRITATTILPQHLPHSLFENKKEGERIFFYYKDQPLELTLTQQKHPTVRKRGNFEDYLGQIQTEFRTQENYLFGKDIPEDRLMINSLPLSKEAKVWDQNARGFVPVTKEAVDFFNASYQNSKTPSLVEKNEQTFVFDCLNLKDENDVNVLVDRKRLIIIGLPTRTKELIRASQAQTEKMLAAEVLASDLTEEVLASATGQPVVRKDSRSIAEKVADKREQGKTLYSTPIVNYYIGLDLSHSSFDPEHLTWEVSNGYLILRSE